MPSLRKMQKRNETTIRPVHPSAALEQVFRKKLLDLVDELNRSVTYWIRASYRANEPRIAQDDLPARALQASISRLARRWLDRFDVASEELADYFSKAVKDRSDRALKSILKKGGFTVEFKMTSPMRDVLRATIAEQVGLIRSIPEKYLSQVQGMVMRSVSTGRDLGQLTKDLEKQYGVTRRRAALISRDQNNKATANFTRVRQVELGITEAIWVHSGGGNHPRPTHLKAGKDRQRYDVSKGWYDPAVQEYILPGQLINCQCVSRSVVKGFS